MERFSKSFLSESTSPMGVSRLEREWQHVLEEERRSYARNQKLLEDFDHVEQQIELFSRKSDSLKHAKHAFETYVSAVYPKWNKELKKWREAQKKNASKRYQQTLSDEDYLKQTKHSEKSFGNHGDVPLTKPVFSSTPHTNGVHDNQDPTQPPVRNGQSMYDGPYGYAQHPGDQLRYRMDRSDHWVHDGYPPDMFGYIPRYPPPGQYEMPWRNIPYYPTHPSYMMGPYGAYHGPPMGGEEGFSRNSDRYFDRAFSRNATDDRSRESQNWDEEFGRNFERSRGEKFHGNGIYGDRSSGRYGGEERFTRHQKSQSLSDERLEIKERLEHSPDLELSPGVKDMVGNDELHHGRGENTESSPRHRKSSKKTTQNRKPDNAHSRKMGEGDSVSGRRGETYAKTGNTKPGDRLFSKESLGVSISDGNVEVDEISDEEDQTMESSSVNHVTTDISSEVKTDEKLYKAGTDSVSLPTIRHFEGNLQDFYSSDTDQVSEFVANDGVISTTSGSRQAVTEPRMKEIRGNELDIRETGSSIRRKDSGSVDETRKKEAVKETRSKELSAKEIDTSGKGKEGDSVATTSKKEASVLDDLVGDDLSDFEVSGLEESGDDDGDNDDHRDNWGNDGDDDNADESTGRDNGDGNKGDGENNGDNADAGDSKSRISSTETPDIQADPGSPSSIKAVERPLVDTGVKNAASSSRSSPQGAPDEVKSTPSTRTTLSSQDNKDLSLTLANKQIIKQEHAPKHDESAKGSVRKDETVSPSLEENVVDEESLLTLLKVVDDDIEVSFSTELLYRHDKCTTEQKLEVVKACKSGKSFEQFDPAVITMVILDQLPRIIRTSTKGSVISDEILRSKKNYLNEDDFRKEVHDSLVVLWRNFFSHFLKMVQCDVMGAKQIAEIFAPCFVSRECSSVDKAVSFLSGILSSSLDDDHQLSIKENNSSREENEDEGVLEELSFSSEDSASPPRSSRNKNNRNTSEVKSVSRDNVSYTEDFEEVKSIPLTETDAYQKMLNSMKVTDEEEDIEEDLLEETMSEANTSGHQRQHYGQASGVPAKSSKSGPKLSLFSSGEVDELDGSFNQGGGLSASWKSSEGSLSPPLSPDLDTGGYVPTVVNEKTSSLNGATITSEKKGQGKAKSAQELSKTDQVKSGGTDTKARIQAGFWNHSDSESEVDLQISHGADGNNDDDDFDFYS